MEKLMFIEKGTLSFAGIFEIDTFQQEMPCVLFRPSANVANVKTAKRRNSNDSRNGGSSVTNVGVG